MAVAIAAAALQCAQGDTPQQVAEALLSRPVAPRRIAIHDRELLHFCAQTPIGETVWPSLSGMVATALEEAALPPSVLADTALFMGTSSHEIGDDEQAFMQARQQEGEAACAMQGRRQGELAARLAARFSLGAGEFTLSTACTASANALVLAAEAIQDGRCRAAVVVAEEHFNHTTLLGFDSMLLLSQQVCRPFDRQRDGMTPGEGLAVVVLVSPELQHEHSPWRGMRWLGGASACDPQGITCSSAEAMVAVMRRALDSAALVAEQIDLIKAHGSASPANDATEAAAMGLLFIPSLPPFTLLKGALGHSFGANGLIEMVALLACLRRGYCPPAHGFTQGDPELACQPLDQALPFTTGRVMFNQFGFGGNNTSFILGLGHHA